MIYYCCANVPLCPIELRMNSECQKHIRVYQTALKSVWNWLFLGNNSLRWIGSLVLWPNHSRIFFWREFFFFYFCRLFEVFHHQRSGLWIWALAIEWQTFSTLILKGFIVKHIICVQYQRNLCKQNLNCRKCILLMNGKMNNKIFLWTKFNCVSSLIFLGHPLV